MAIDSHIHINSVVIDNISEEINLINNNPYINSVINVGLNYKTSCESILISSSNSKFYSSVGIHPLYIEKENINLLYGLVPNDKVVAIGEIGLDILHDNLDIQKRYFIEQIKLANYFYLPVIIHSNNMNKEIINIFENTIKPEYGCIFHCFQPEMDILKYLIENNYYISFAGKITYKNAKKSIDVIKEVPNNLFLVETDSPYISPEPYRDSINHSSNINYIINRISEVKGLSYEEVEDITSENTKRLFKRIGKNNI